jgi:hypothetical protein
LSNIQNFSPGLRIQLNRINSPFEAEIPIHLIRGKLSNSKFLVEFQRQIKIHRLAKGILAYFSLSYLELNSNSLV